MLYTVAAAFLNIAFALSAMTLILAVSVSRTKDKYFVAGLSGFAGAGYLMVIYGDVVRVEYLWIINLLAFFHFGVAFVFSLTKTKTSVVSVKTNSASSRKPIKNVRYTWEPIPVRIKILTAHEPNRGSNRQFFADFRLHNGTWFGGTLGFVPDEDGTWVWDYSLSVPKKGTYMISLLDHTFPVSRTGVNSFVIP